MKSFASDNYAPVAPEVLDFLAEVNRDHTRSYGADPYTERARQAIQTALGRPDAAVNFVLTGTAANVLSIKQCLRSTESVLVPQTSHLTTNEGGSPEAFTQSKLIHVPVVHGKIDLTAAERVLRQELDNLPHTPRPRMLSIAQSTEYGTVYSLDELNAVSAFCKQYNLLLHLDLCRVYNAAVALNVPLDQIITAANPDIASLGGTKNGLMFAEAVVIFNPQYQADFAFVQKQAMQLYSKMRFLAAQFIPYFEQKIWERNARHANVMGAYLHSHIKDLPGVEITRPVQTNQVFLKLPPSVIAPLQAVVPFYVWESAINEVRLVTSFDTVPEEIDLFAAKLKELLTTPR